MNKAIKQMRKEYKRLLKGKKIELILNPWPAVKIKTTVRWEDDNYATADENAIEDQIRKAVDKYRDELYLEYWLMCCGFNWDGG